MDVDDDGCAAPLHRRDGLLQAPEFCAVEGAVQLRLEPLPQDGHAKDVHALAGEVGDILRVGIDIVEVDAPRQAAAVELRPRDIHAFQGDTCGEGRRGGCKGCGAQGAHEREAARSVCRHRVLSPGPLDGAGRKGDVAVACGAERIPFRNQSKAAVLMEKVDPDTHMPRAQ